MEVKCHQYFCKYHKAYDLLTNGALGTVLSNWLILSRCHQYQSPLSQGTANPQCNFNLHSFNHNFKCLVGAKDWLPHCFTCISGFQSTVRTLEVLSWGVLPGYTKPLHFQLFICDPGLEFKTTSHNRSKCRTR